MSFRQDEQDEKRFRSHNKRKAVREFVEDNDLTIISDIIQTSKSIKNLILEYEAGVSKIHRETIGNDGLLLHKHNVQNDDDKILIIGFGGYRLVMKVKKKPDRECD